MLYIFQGNKLKWVSVEEHLWQSLYPRTTNLMYRFQHHKRTMSLTQRMMGKSLKSDLPHLPLTLKMPRKPASENVVYLCRLLNIPVNFSNLFLHTGKVWTLSRLLLVWSGSTLFAKMTFKIKSRWQSRQQLLWLAVYGLMSEQFDVVYSFCFQTASAGTKMELFKIWDRYGKECPHI